MVMPNGFGFNWPGHSASAAYVTLSRITIRPGGRGLADAAQAAVTSLARGAGVKLARGQPAPTPRRRRVRARACGWQRRSGARFECRHGRCGVAVASRSAIALALLARRAGPAPGRARLSGACRLRRPGHRIALAGSLRSPSRRAVVVLALPGRPRRRSAKPWRQPEPRSGHAAHRPGARLHAHRPVRPPRLAALVPRQGRAARVQRLRVHDDLPADHDRDARRQGDARARREAASSCWASTPTRRRPRSKTCSPTRSCTGCSTRGTSSPARSRSCDASGRPTTSRPPSRGARSLTPRRCS